MLVKKRQRGLAPAQYVGACSKPIHQTGPMIYTVYYWIVRDGKQRGYNFLVENDVMRMRTHQNCI